MKTLISIITPAFNAERFVSFTINSVLAQTHRTWEMLIVIDPKSTDSTRSIAESYANKDSRIKVITSTKGGVASNRNLGIAAAQGEYVAFLDSDDLWHPHKLSNQLNFMRSQDIQASCHSYQPISEDGNRKYKIRDVPSLASYQDLLKDNTVGCLTVMIKKAALPQPAFVDGPHEDLTLWLKIARTYEFYGLKNNLAFYRIVKGSRSNNKLFAAWNRWHILRYVERHSFAKSCTLFVYYMFNSLRKRR